MEDYGTIPKIELVLEGGRERSDSVKKALHYIYSHKKSDIILIHDGARPFITSDLIKLIGQTARKNGAALPVMKISETVRQKIKDDPKKPSFIKTIWGEGYLFIGEHLKDEI